MAGLLPAHMVTVHITNRCPLLQIDPVPHQSTQLGKWKKRGWQPLFVPSVIHPFTETTCTQQH